MALLGSNHARNRAAAQDAKERAEWFRPFLLRVVAQCQEKPIDEAFPVFAAHTTVGVDVTLEVSKDTLEPVVCVGHSIDLEPSEEIWQIEADTGHRRTQPPMCIEGLSGLVVDGAFIQERLPLHNPSLEGFSETIPVADCQRGHERFQFPSRLQTRVTRELPPDDGAHVVLAHLYHITLKEREQRLHPVDDNAVNHIAATLDPGNGIGIVRCALMGDVLQVQRASAG